MEYQAGGELMERAESVPLYPGIELEGFPNRDSVAYIDMYGVQEAHTFLRGTLRYKVELLTVNSFV